MRLTYLLWVSWYIIVASKLVPNIEAMDLAVTKKMTLDSSKDMTKAATKS